MESNTKKTNTKVNNSATEKVAKKTTSTKKVSEKNTAETTQIEEKELKLEKYLPIGSVVLLKGGIKRVMITGFCVTRKDKPYEIWDYCGCPYPEGILSTENIFMFDHQQITAVFHLGLDGDEERDFKKRLKEEIKKLQETNNSQNDNSGK